VWDCDIYFVPNKLHGLTHRRFVNLPLLPLKSTITQFNMERLILPTHIRGPSPNGIYEYFGRLCLFSSVKRSGSKISGSGKYCGSYWIPNRDTKTAVPAGSVIVPFPEGDGSS